MINIVSTEMKLQPNIGSDRSWVWKVAADYAENPPTAETLAIRFANSDSGCGLHVPKPYDIYIRVRCRSIQARL